jgi:peptidoglycan/LPS O-acetylase OafA/YrhL
VKRLGYQPALDGIRGLAIAAVCGIHFFGLGGGFLGVDIFFVLSGFLITTLLLDEHDRNGAIDLVRFYRRRIRRLLPGLALLLVVAVPLAGFAAGGGKAAEFFALGLYSMNFARAFFGSNNVLSGHLWSLAQEEQFYLLWPALLIVLLRRRSFCWTVMALAVMFCVLVSYRAALAVSGAGWARIYFGPDTHADGLVLGCLAAFLRRAGLRIGGTTGLAALGAICGLLVFAVWRSRSAAIWQITAAEIASALLVLAALEPGPLRRLFSFAPVVWLGCISYSLYLWQGFGLSGAGLPGALIMAVLSYYVVERKFRSSPREVKGLAPASPLSQVAES